MYEIKPYRGHYALFKNNDVYLECDSRKECEEELDLLESKLKDYQVFCEVRNERGRWIITHFNTKSANEDEAKSDVKFRLERLSTKFKIFEAVEVV